ncbi:unnamed protein product [Rotaria sp. Silwood2]|nr:unnamed protein product [Rotaria sp. Silwood2]CAF3287748.1 unnamed protein product [Rotaria sp. Silwood2]
MDDSQAFSHGPVTHEFTLSPMETFSSDIILSATQDNEFVHISMQPLQNEIRSPCDICCVVDTSGSMSPAAEIENDKNEHYGLSQLDLVKHALKTIINSLQDQDRLSLISFSDKATILFKLTAMNEAGKTKALDKVEKLRDEDDGNWSLAQQSLSVASAGASLSSARPALSMAPAVEWVNDQVPLPIAISIAIPNMAQRSQVDICCVIDVSGSMGEDAKFQDPNDASKFVTEGPLHFGSHRDLIVPMKIPVGVHDHHHPFLKVTLEWNSENNNHKESLIGSDFVVTADALAAFARMSSVHSLEQVIDKCDATDPAGPKILKTLIGQLIGLEATAKDARITALLKGDLQERISKAVSTVERYQRWGAHYLRAILRSHEYQMRTNFMDPGLQVYGGVLFSELVHSGGEIFKGLPLKKYSDRDANSNSNNNNRNNNAIAAAVPVADSYYAGNCGGCFSGECVVQCKEQDGMVREKQLSQVRDYLFG